jgi:hypothetical protein
MHNPVTIITDKVMRMAGAMVYLALSATYRRGATAGELAGFLSSDTVAEAGFYHEGMVERVLRQLHSAGRVTRDGAHWYPVLNG